MIDKQKHKVLQEKYLRKEAELVKSLFFCSESKDKKLQEKGLNIINSLKDNLFNNEENKLIFNTIKDYYAQGITVPIISEKTKIDPLNLAILLEEGVFSCSIKVLQDTYDCFIKLYKALFVAKLLINSYNEIMETESAENFEKNVVYKVSQLPQIISNEAGYKDIVQINSELLDKIMKAGEGKVSYCKTGINSFDHQYFGLEGGKTYVVAARQGVGKSNIALNWLSKIVFEQKKKALFFSLEMDEGSMNERLISMYAGVPHTFIKNVSLKGYKLENKNPQYHKNYEKLIETMVKFEEYKENLFILTKCRTMSSIHSNAVMFKYKHDIDVIFVDYVQLVKDKGKDETEMASNAARNLFLLGQELDVPIVMLCQINREGSSSPELHNLSKSDVIGQVANMVLIIDKKPEEAEGKLKIVKARDFATGTIPITFDSERLAFSG